MSQEIKTTVLTTETVNLEAVTTVPTPQSGKYTLAAKNDGSLIFKDSAGTETNLLAGGGGGNSNKPESVQLSPGLGFTQDTIIVSNANVSYNTQLPTPSFNFSTDLKTLSPSPGFQPTNTPNPEGSVDGPVSPAELGSPATALFTSKILATEYVPLELSTRMGQIATGSAVLTPWNDVAVSGINSTIRVSHRKLDPGVNGVYVTVTPDAPGTGADAATSNVLSINACRRSHSQPASTTGSTFLSDVIWEPFYYNGLMYFVGANAQGGNKLFYYDDSQGTVYQLADITGSPNGQDFNVMTDGVPWNPVIYNNKMYFVAVNSTGYQKLFEIDTNNALKEISEINTTNDFVDGWKGIVFNSKLYFVAASPGGGNGIAKLFCYDGSIFSQVSDLSYNTSQSDFNLTKPESTKWKPFLFNGALYFIGTLYTGFRKLFKVDSSDQIFQITDIGTSGGDDFYDVEAWNPATFNSALYFGAVDPGYGNLRLYRVDSSDVVDRVSRTQEFYDDLLLRPMVVFENELYFTGQLSADPASFVATLPRFLMKVNTSNQISQVTNFGCDDNTYVQVVFNGSLYFTASGTDSQARLYRVVSGGGIEKVTHINDQMPALPVSGDVPSAALVCYATASDLYVQLCGYQGRVFLARLNTSDVLEVIGGMSGQSPSGDFADAQPGWIVRGASDSDMYSAANSGGAFSPPSRKFFKLDVS